MNTSNRKFWFWPVLKKFKEPGETIKPKNC